MCKCEYCGRRNKADAEVCGSCGANLPDPTIYFGDGTTGYVPLGDSKQQITWDGYLHGGTPYDPYEATRKIRAKADAYMDWRLG